MDISAHQLTAVLSAASLESEHELDLHDYGSTYPNWHGEDQVRMIDISGNEMKVVSPASAVGGGMVHLLLRRIR